MSYARDKRIADEFLAENTPPQPCSFCGAMTPYETLSRLGARCGKCFAAYCRGSTPKPANPVGQSERRRIIAGLKALATPRSGRDWAYRLREREQGGEKLTAFQREAWRRVIGGDDES